MELKLVSKEIALQLKELGFDNIDCNAYYHINEGYELGYTLCYSNEYKQDILVLLAPTQALIVKYLRDVHNIHFHIDYSNQQDLYAIHWEVPKMESNRIIRPAYKTFELAEEVGILKALEILKNKVNENNIS